MNKENTNKLLINFPKLYVKLRNNTFECKDGWFDLIYKMSEELSNLQYQLSITAVKEKFGTLALYSDFENQSYANPVYSIIEKYEKLSQTICEICGDIGKLTPHQGWWFVMCDSHRREIEFRKLLK